MLVYAQAFIRPHYFVHVRICICLKKWKFLTNKMIAHTHTHHLKCIRLTYKDIHIFCRANMCSFDLSLDGKRVLIFVVYDVWQRTSKAFHSNCATEKMNPKYISSLSLSLSLTFLHTSLCVTHFPFFQQPLSLCIFTHLSFLYKISFHNGQH